MSHNRFRILALDIDGTLLDHEGKLRSTTIEALHRAVQSGIKPILCTGRRYRSTLPIAEQLNLDSPIVCNSGALIKNPREHKTIWRADLPFQLVGDLLSLFQEFGQQAISFTDRSLDQTDFLIERFRSGCPLFDDYVEQNRRYAEIDPGWTARFDIGHYHICAVGEKSLMLELQTEILKCVSESVQTFVQRSPRYAGTMCEILRHDANKWTALLQIAREWGITPEEICAVGDDNNDVPMLQGAGLGVAMGHANSDVIDSADQVTGSHFEDGVAMLIDEVLLA